MQVYCNENGSEIQLKLAIEDAPPRVRAYGLREAHHRPLVGVRDDDGRFLRSFRRPQHEAWEYSDLEYPRSARSWAALVVDVDSPERLWEHVGAGSSLLPNWCVVNKRNGHAHVVYPLTDPVHLHPEANPKPLEYLADIEKKLLVALDGDTSYPGVMARNPIIKPRWGTEVHWFRREPWELSELDEAATAALPEGWRPAQVQPGAVGRNCALFMGLCKWAGRETNRYESIYRQALDINSTFETPLPLQEMKATARSVEKYRERWEARGWHSPRWIQRQKWRGMQSGKVRRPGSNEALMPWNDEGISRRTWYRRRAKAKVALEPTQGDRRVCRSRL